MRCDLQIFSGCVCHLEQLHAQSPFLFPIVFSINYVYRSVLESAATAKKIKHKQACADRRADFTPFVCSTDGAVHREGQHFLRRLAARLATKWEMPYARVMNFVRTRLSIAILRATGHCVRGARRKFFSLSTDGGLAVALFS